LKPRNSFRGNKRGTNSKIVQEVSKCVNKYLGTGENGKKCTDKKNTGGSEKYKAEQSVVRGNASTNTQFLAKRAERNVQADRSCNLLRKVWERLQKL